MSLKERLSPERIEKVKKRFLQVEHLPTISSTFDKIINMIDQESTTIREIEQIIKLDQAITIRVLKIINSPFYGYSDVTTISKAIVLLGFKELKNIVVSAAIINVLDARQPIAGLKVSDFWLHSMAVAFISRFLAKNLDLSCEQESFTIGLLHDIGKVAYLKEDPQLMGDLMTLAKSRQISFAQAEEIVGLSHSQVGWYLGEKWNLPERLCGTIRQHHQPDPESVYFIETAMVHLADHIAVKLQIGNSGNACADPLDPAALHSLKLNDQLVSKILDRIEEKKDALVQVAKNLLSN
ncbi:MAG: HDOD domain-containing protein [Deltaproteobacteria bacterium]|nr:HDOD domain-containing protein [Deltaproteobacteria bacterium]